MSTIRGRSSFAPPGETEVVHVTLEPDWVDGTDPVDAMAAQALPYKVCRHFGMLPVSYADGVLTVAVTDPQDMLAQSVARALAHEQLRVVVAPSDEIDRAIDRVYAGHEDDAVPETVVDVTGTVAEKGKLGGLLVSRELVDESQLADALQTQDRTGSKLGEILIHERLIREVDLVAALADQLEIPLIDLEELEPQPEALAEIPESIQRALRAVPLELDDEYVYIAVAEPLDDDAMAAIAEHTELEPSLFLAPGKDVDQLLRDVHREEYIRASRTELLETNPEDCANRVISDGQRAFLIALGILTVVCAVINPLATAVGFVVASSAIYGITSLYKFKLFFDSFGRRQEAVVSAEEVAALDERDCPVYTILVPLYDEAEVIPRLTQNLGSLDYPKEKLEILLLNEEDDEATREAILAMDLPPQFKLLIVPDSLPKTKPKACNYGLLQATGDYVVIFDAEDKPDPDQLKKVLIAWRQSDDDNVACVQCKLNYFNTDQNILTRFFATEYALWFDLLLPGLDASGAPIPLGGTSNHFDRQILLELGAWDPFNVTEDADLGMRLHKAGYKTGMLDSTTLEEANSDLSNWIRQRSRWVKGYLQTYLVHMRHPVKLFRTVGWKAFLSFQCIVGGTVIFLLNPIFWALTTVWILTQAGVIESLFPGFLYYAASAQLLIGNFVFTYLAVAGSLQRRMFSLTKYALFSPIYWGLMSIGAYRGFWQLMTKPFYWEKTIHGLDAGEH